MWESVTLSDMSINASQPAPAVGFSNFWGVNESSVANSKYQTDATEHIAVWRGTEECVKLLSAASNKLLDHGPLLWEEAACWFPVIQP